MSNQRGFAPLLIILLIAALIGGYLVYSGKININQQTNTQSTSNESLNLKTFNGSTYSFKYPAKFVYGYLWNKTDKYFDQNNPYFFANQKDADESLDCFSNSKGSFSNPCKSGLFAVSDITNYPLAKRDFSSFADEPFFQKYKDSQNREWTIVGPIHGLDVSETDVEVKIKGITHQLQIHITDAFISSDPSLKDAAGQLEYIKKLLSTVEFTPQDQSEKEGEDYIMWQGRKLTIIRVKEGEYCEGYVGSQQTTYKKCGVGFKCVQPAGSIADAPGTCVKE